MRVDESWRSNASESCNSHQLSSSFDRAFTLSVQKVKRGVRKVQLNILPA